MSSMLLIGAIVLPWVALQASEGAGDLTKAQGQVWVMEAGSTESVAHAGGKVGAGARVRTGPASLAEVTFADGSLLQVQSQSQVQLSQNKRQHKKNAVVLFFGRIWSRVTQSAGGDTNYEVKTPNAVCGVRGTEFVTQVADDGSLRVGVDKGKVAVQGDGGGSDVDAGEQVDADESGVGKEQAAEGGDKQWQSWSQAKQERLKAQSGDIVAKIKAKIMSRKDKLEALQGEKKALEEKRSQARDNPDALQEINDKLARIADAVADLGDEATSQIGLVDHFADLAADPRFKGINRKTLEAEAKSLRAVKAMLDKLVAEGTDISAASMDKMMHDMHDGKRGTLKDKRGSSAQDLFGE